jgi:ribosome-binding factor A
MNEVRQRKIEEQMRSEIASLLVKGEVKDPRVNSFLSVTRVSVSGDLCYAKVFVSTFEDEAALGRGVEGLNSAAGFIQGKVARAMRLRQTPKLTFFADEGLRNSFDLTQKLKDLGS